MDSHLIFVCYKEQYPFQCYNRKIIYFSFSNCVIIFELCSLCFDYVFALFKRNAMQATWHQNCGVISLATFWFQVDITRRHLTLLFLAMFPVSHSKDCEQRYGEQTSGSQWKEGRGGTGDGYGLKRYKLLCIK